jgi:hypothetical protein
MASLGKALIALGAVLLLYGVGLVLGQGIAWLASERWVGLPLILLLMDHGVAHHSISESIASSPESYLWPLVPRVASLPSWIIAPKHWPGAHRVAMVLLTQVSVPGAAVGLSLAALAAGFKLTKSD